MKAPKKLKARRKRRKVKSNAVNNGFES
jgi:hypothetical protein